MRRDGCVWVGGEQGHLPKVVVVGMSSADESTQSALNVAGTGELDIAQCGGLAVPVKVFEATQLRSISTRLPIR